MSFADLVRRMFRKAATPKNRNRTILNVNSLEDRTVPTATVTVVSLANITEDGSAASFRFTRTETSGSLSVGITNTGTAVAGISFDYTYSPMVMFADGSATTDLSITPCQDSNVEGTETIIMTISSSGFYNIGSPGAATMNLYDDDTPQVTVAKQGGDPTEPGTGTFRITRTGSTSGNLTVNYTAGGAATSGTDYTSIGTSATITSGNSYMDVSVVTLADNVVEAGGESATITISDGGSSYTAYGSGATATMTIVDDPPVVSIAPTDTIEGENGKFRISRTGGKTSDSLTVNYTVTGGAADSGDDFTALSGSVSIGGGNSYADVTVTALVDNLIEGDENLEVTISSGGGVYTIAGGGGGVATLTITDDPPVVSIARLTDGEEGGSDGVFRVSRTGGDITEALVVTYTVDGTAVGESDEDYVELTGTATIGANDTYEDVTIDVTDDGSDESTETVILTLDSSEDYLLNSASDTLFIWDDDVNAFHWTGAEDANWMNEDNWAENDVPGVDDAVFFTGSYTDDATLSGPLSPYTIRELHVASGYTGTITLSFPLSVGSLRMQGGTIDQPSSGYGSDLTITLASLWSGGVLNSTANAAQVIFDGARVAIDGTADLETGSELVFENAEAVVGKGSITFSNAMSGTITGTSVVQIIGGVLAPSGGTGGGVVVDGGSVDFYGSTSIEWLYVLHGGKATTRGNAALTLTGTTSGLAVLVEGGDLNIQNGTSLNAGSNWIGIYGASASGNLNTFASILAPGVGTETATINAGKLILGHPLSGNTTVTLGNAALRPDLGGVHRFSQLQINGAVEWVKGTYVPTVGDDAGDRDRWVASGTFKIEGSATTVAPTGTTTVNREDIVVEAPSISAYDGKSTTLPSVSTINWDWKPGTAYGGANWSVKVVL